MAKKRSHEPAPTSACSKCLALLKEFIFCKSVDMLPALKHQILETVPLAKQECMEVGEDADVAQIFGEIEAALSVEDDLGFVARHMALHKQQSRIAQWDVLRTGLSRLRTWKAGTGDPVTAFVAYATEALNLVEQTCSWFPDLDVDAGFTCPKERGLLSAELAPRYTPDVHQTLVSRAVAQIRERGEASFGVPKLERIDNGIHELAGLVGNCSGKGVMSDPRAMELSQAICDATVLIDKKTSTKRANSAVEACALLRNEWATAKELTKPSGRSEYAIRSAVNREIRKLKGFERGAFRDLNIRPFPDPLPGMPKQEYRIVGVWPLLVPS